MLFHFKNGRLKTGNTSVDYIRFGTGKKFLIFIPGLGDGLKTVSGTALPFSFLYRKFSKDYTVYVFSRKNDLPENYATKQMADDLYVYMNHFQIDKADIVGVSQGGMIAQHLAIHYPQKVNKLILVVTLAQQNNIVNQTVTHWIELVRSRNVQELFLDTARKSYSEPYLKKSMPFYTLLSKTIKLKNPQRFLTMAHACLSHNSYQELASISCPTLIIAGAKDQIVGVEASREIASKINHSQLFIYEQLGHGLYEEAKDFIPRVLSFLTQTE